MSAIEKVNALTQEQREKAFELARIQIAGVEPTPTSAPQLADFLRNAESILPPNLSRLITGLSGFMLIVAFMPSAIRLHAVGVMAFSQSVAHVTSVYVAAICIVFMSEIGQVIFSLAIANTRVGWQKTLMLVGALLSTGFALSGNAVAVGDHATENLFTVLETYAPPILVLITAQVLKTQMLHIIEGRYVGKREYAQAYTEWERRNQDIRNAWMEAYQNAHTDGRWQRTSANALRDALRRANGRSTAVIRSLTPGDWLELITREWQADQWYTIEVTRIEEAQSIALLQSRSSSVRGSHTGEATGHVVAMTATCPHCGWSKTYDTVEGAQAGLNVHIGRYCPKKGA